MLGARLRTHSFLVLPGLALLFALGAAFPAMSHAEVIAPHVAQPQKVTPQVESPPPAPAPEPPPVEEAAPEESEATSAPPPSADNATGEATSESSPGNLDPPDGGAPDQPPPSEFPPGSPFEKGCGVNRSCAVPDPGTPFDQIAGSIFCPANDVISAPWSAWQDFVYWSKLLAIADQINSQKSKDNLEKRTLGLWGMLSGHPYTDRICFTTRIR